MDAPLHAIVVRLIRSMGQVVEDDWVSDDQVWAFLPHLVAPLKAGHGLPAGVMHVVMELGLMLAISPGAPAAAYQQALEAELGPSPYPADEFAELVSLMREQVNGHFEKATGLRGPNLTGEGGSAASNKNYEYG